MTKIKLTTNKDKGQLFTIECYMPSFEPQNKTVRIRHAGMFKHDKYTFHPQKDLVFSMPYDFVANLKPGHWTLLDILWLKSVKKILKKAKTNSIKQIRLVRLPKKHFIGNQTMSFKNSNEDVIYEAVTYSRNSSFLVSLHQIYDIVGEEDWIHCESNCLVNLASGRTITLSWGAKKKEHKEQCTLLSDECLQVGDLVVVKNHGDQWPHKACIIEIDVENKLAMIKWETTQKTDFVDLEDLKGFSMENSTLRKKNPPIFFLPFEAKKLFQISNINQTDLICNIAQKISFFQ